MKINLTRYVGTLTRDERVQILNEFTLALHEGKLHEGTMLNHHASKIIEITKQDEESRQSLLVMIATEIAVFYANLYVMQYQGKVPR